MPQNRTVYKNPRLESPKPESRGCLGRSGSIIELNRLSSFWFTFSPSFSYFSHTQKWRAFWYLLCNPVHMFPSLGANNRTLSPSVCQEKITHTLFTVCYTTILFPPVNSHFCSSSMVTPSAEIATQRDGQSLWVTENKSLILCTLKYQTGCSPKITPWDKRESFYFF